MGSFPVIVPPAPGLLCAIGDLVADFRDEFAQTYIRAARRRERRRGRARSWTGSARGRRRGSRARGSPRTRSGSRTAPTCATTGRATRSRSRSTRTRCARTGSPMLEERFNGLHEQLYGFRMPGTDVRDRQPPRGRVRGRAEARAARSDERGGADASGAVVDEHEVVFDGERVPTKIYDRAKLEPGQPHRGPGDRHRVRLDDGRPPGHAAEVDAELQHPDQPEAREGGRHGSTDKLRIAEIPRSTSTRSRSTSSRAR